MPYHEPVTEYNTDPGDWTSMISDVLTRYIVSDMDETELPASFNGVRVSSGWRLTSKSNRSDIRLVFAHIPLRPPIVWMCHVSHSYARHRSSLYIAAVKEYLLMDYTIGNRPTVRAVAIPANAL